MYEGNPYFYGTGRRKKSVARVRVYPGTGKIVINDRDIDDYFGLETLKLIVRQPLAITGSAEKFDIICRVSGGGVSGQAGAGTTGTAKPGKPCAVRGFSRNNHSNTVSKAPAALRSSASADISFKTAKPLEFQRFRGFFFLSRLAGSVFPAPDGFGMFCK